MSMIASNKLLPELFPIILSHMPPASRIPTSLSVARTSRLLHDLLIPNILYRDVHLVDDDLALNLLERLINAATASKDKSKLGEKYTVNQCIRHWTIEITEAEAPLAGLLQNLIDFNGLPNLVSFTLPFVIHSTLPNTLWRSLKDNCPSLKGVHLRGFMQHDGWFQSEVFTFKELTSIRIAISYDTLKDENRFVDLSNIPSKLHTLELRIRATGGGAIIADCPGGLLSCNLPHLRTLIIDYFCVRQPDIATEFWKTHHGLERLELCSRLAGDWFQDFEGGMLPNLKILKTEPNVAKCILPLVAKSLVSLYLLNTYNAQATYLLRAIPEGGTLPALRRLGIQRKSGNSPKDKKYEGHRWREDENGRVTEVERNAAPWRRFDGNYLMSIANAAPSLEALELMGDSDDTIDSITASLCLMPNLYQLTLSDPTLPSWPAFFPWSSTWPEYANLDLPALKDTLFKKYRPLSFDEAVRDLANGCRTLETVTFARRMESASMLDGLSVRIVRDSEEGSVKETRPIRAWGTIMGTEED